MKAAPIAIEGVGLVTSLGLDARTTCAAVRAGISNATDTAFLDDEGEWLLGHQVALEQPWRGRAKLLRMAVMAAQESMQPMAAPAAEGVPMLLCVAEPERPGRDATQDERLFDELRAALGLKLHPVHSGILAAGRVGALMALAHARHLIVEEACPQVLIVAVDSLLSWPTLRGYSDEDRLLSRTNSNGFIPGEGAGALLVRAALGSGDEFTCMGFGAGHEPAPMGSDEPLRADGLTAAIRQALAEAGCEMRDLHWRIVALSGEQYFFKEASLALARTLRRGPVMMDLWHPASGIGETGALAGAAVVATAWMAWKKGYGLGTRVLLHGSADGPRRVAIIASGSGAAS